MVLLRLRRVVGFQFDLHIRNSYHNILTISNISDTGKKAQVLTDPDLSKKMVDLNYELGEEYFSCKKLKVGLKRFIEDLRLLPVKI